MSASLSESTDNDQLSIDKQNLDSLPSATTNDNLAQPEGRIGRRLLEEYIPGNSQNRKEFWLDNVLAKIQQERPSSKLLHTSSAESLSETESFTVPEEIPQPQPRLQCDDFCDHKESEYPLEPDSSIGSVRSADINSDIATELIQNLDKESAASRRKHSADSGPGHQTMKSRTLLSAADLNSDEQKNFDTRRVLEEKVNQNSRGLDKRRWSDEAQWPDLRLPQKGEDVEIPEDWDLVLDTNASVGHLTINGKLTFLQNA